MKALMKLLGALMIFSSGLTSWSQSTQGTAESINSFYTTLEGINWNDYEDKTIKTSSCEPDFKGMISKIKTPTYDKNVDYNNTVDQLKELVDLIENASTNLKLNENYPGRRRAKLYYELGRHKTLKEFQTQFRFDPSFIEYDLTDQEKEALEKIFNAHKKLLNSKGVKLYKESYDIDFQKVLTVEILIKPLRVEMEKIAWLAIARISAKCTCYNTTAKYDVFKASAVITKDFVSIFPENQPHEMVFSATAEKPKYGLINIDCCSFPDADYDNKYARWDYDDFINSNYTELINPKPKGGNTNSGEDNNENDDNSDDNENNQTDDNGDQGSVPDSEDKECCSIKSPKQTIGILPGFALTDNFENFSYDVAIEYLRNFGNSFANNTIYGGALAGYMGEDRQDGEVKETMWYVAGIIENRTPISICEDVQWVQRVCVLYGEGEIDAFGNKDEFTQLTFGIHTGFNFQLNDNIALGADVTVLDFGTTTFKPENGPEIDQDIGDLNANKGNRVRFGIRFRF